MHAVMVSMRGDYIIATACSEMMQLEVCGCEGEREDYLEGGSDCKLATRLWTASCC